MLEESRDESTVPGTAALSPLVELALAALACGLRHRTCHLVSAFLPPASLKWWVSALWLGHIQGESSDSSASYIQGCDCAALDPWPQCVSCVCRLGPQQLIWQILPQHSSALCSLQERSMSLIC